MVSILNVELDLDLSLVLVFNSFNVSLYITKFDYCNAFLSDLHATVIYWISYQQAYITSFQRL